MADKTRVLEDCDLIIETICDCTEFDAEIENLAEELTVISELVSQCVRENAKKKQSQEEYTKKYNGLVRRYEKAEKRLNEASLVKAERINKAREIHTFYRMKPQPFQPKLSTVLYQIQLLSSACFLMHR